MTDSTSSGPGLFHLTWCPTGSSTLLQMTGFYSSHGRMVVHRVCTSHFPYPPLGWWSLLLLLYLGYWSNVAGSMAMRMSFDTPMLHPWAVIVMDASYGCFLFFEECPYGFLWWFYYFCWCVRVVSLHPCCWFLTFVLLMAIVLTEVTWYLAAVLLCFSWMISGA